MSEEDQDPDRVPLEALLDRLGALRRHALPDPDPVAEPTEQQVQQAQLLERWQALVPRRFQGARLEHFTDRPAVQEPLTGWLEEGGTRSLVLVGPVGTGKTYAAVAVMRERMRAGARPRLWSMVELLDKLRPDGPPGTWEAAASTDLLVLDDVGAERATDWTQERLYALLDHRWREELPLVVTSNLEPDQLQEALGERGYSRLVHGALVVRLAGQDRRRT